MSAENCQASLDWAEVRPGLILHSEAARAASQTSLPMVFIVIVFSHLLCLAILSNEDYSRNTYYVEPFII